MVLAAGPSALPGGRGGRYNLPRVMDKRFGAAVTTAVVLHAALLGLMVRASHSQAPFRGDTSPDASAAELELTMLMEDGASSLHDETSSNVAATPGRPSLTGTAPRRALSRPLAPNADADAEHAADPDGSVPGQAELQAGGESEGSSTAAAEAASGVRARVDLGLDGSVLRHAALEARKQVPRRRPTFSLAGGWSDTVVRSFAQSSAPWQGRALLTLEWDSTGKLRSVTSSAASSSSQDWQRLARGLTSQLAARSNTAAQGTGLRLVYLVESELVIPESNRSVIPSAKYASAEQLRADNLPPATTLNIGVKADNSAATTRRVSVNLVRSELP